MKWQAKLTKAELKHLRTVAGCRTLTDFKRSRKSQKAFEQDAIDQGFDPGIATCCFECNAIARKLGIE
jgi:hypothetical protein